MNEAEIKSRLETIFKSVFDNNAIVLNESMTANDIEEWNSLTHMIMISEVEKAFNVKFKLRELNKLNNVGNLIELIQSKL